MSDVPNGPGWWQASDGKWYPPDSFNAEAETETFVDAGAADSTTTPPTATAAPGATGGAAGPQGAGWWQATDGLWYPPEAAGGYPAVQPGYGAGYANPANLDPQAKSKLVAGLLGILVGGFGVHRFDLGYTSIGIIQIVVTLVTCGLGAIWGLVEGILILVGNDNFRTDATGRPLKD
jgi:TM2 domain-containing membrane protein YozV